VPESLLKLYSSKKVLKLEMHDTFGLNTGMLGNKYVRDIKLCARGTP